MRKIRSLVIVLVVVLALSINAIKAQDKTIAEVAKDAGTFNTLLAAVQAAGLDTVLSDPAFGPVTVFAPNDDAFAKIPPAVLEYLLKPENKELLTRILTYHVVSGKIMAADVSTMMAPSMEMTAPGAEPTGSQLNVQVTDAGVKVNSANVIATDIEASNGVIHVIDSVILPEITLPEVDALAVSDNIIAAGSSTVYPLAERMADQFTDAGFAGTITVDSIGSGAGFERFCVNAETDISTASVAISSEQTDACTANNRTPMPFFVGIDALAISVSSANTFVDTLTVEQLGKIFSGEAKTWADVNPAWPAEAIQLFSPGTDSGTFTYFVEKVFAKDNEKLLNAPGIQLSEDDNVLVQGIEGSEYAIGYFGFAYYLENKDKLRAIPIEGIEPNETTAENGTYPMSRPLYLYSDAGILQAKPQVAAFINFFLSNVNSQLGTEEGKIGYFPVSSDSLNLDKLAWLAATNTPSTAE